MPRTSPYRLTLTDAERTPSWKDGHADIRHRIQTSCGPRSCFTRPRGWATTRSPHAWTPRDRWYPSGANASTSSACPDLPISPGEDDPPVFPPDVVVAVKALACELPTTADAPLARWHCPDLARAAVEQGIVAAISGTTIWRWLCADAIKPWQHRSWIFPGDPDFATKAPRVLDLYARRFNDAPLRPDE